MYGREKMGMGVIRLREHVYSVGVQDPALRTVDITLPIHYGTSYNAYLITGESNLLVETVPEEFFAEYLENISSVVPLEMLDYLILNHTEPDQGFTDFQLIRVVLRLAIIP